MPSVLHEVLRELFAKRPHLIAPLLLERLRLPPAPFVAVDSEQTDPRMRQLLPDAVLACPSATAPAMIVIVEVHLQITEPKRRVWPQYAATAHGRFGCAAALVVVTPSTVVERWAARPIEVGPGHTMVPAVLGPSAIPWVDESQAHQAPALAMLSTLAHMDDPACAQQALWTFEALASWPEDADGRLADILEAALTVAVHARMEELMEAGKWEYQSDFAKKYFARGRLEGREEGREEGVPEGQGRALLLVLRARGLEVPVEVADRIGRERDEARLDQWTMRASVATTLDEVFADE
jgi:hypothetical protein